MKWQTAGSLVLAALVAGTPGCIQNDAAAPAPGTIDGAVTDETANGMAGVTVMLEPLGVQEMTGPRGGFSFYGVAPGTYTVTAASPGRVTDRQVVEVASGKAVQVILWLPPTSEQASFIETHAKPTLIPLAMPGTECEMCHWTVSFSDAPVEADFAASWDAVGPQADLLRFEVRDENDELLYSGEQATPFTSLSFGRTDLGRDSGELRIRVYFEAGFTPRPNFHLDMVWTFYYGATYNEFFAA